MLFYLFFTVICIYLMQIHVYADLYCHKPFIGVQQIRIAIQSSDAVTVSWMTYGQFSIGGIEFIYGFDDTPEPKVVYSKFSNFSNNITSNGTSRHYDTSEYGSWFHDVTIYVNDSTTYYYQILKSKCREASKVLNFTTPPADGDSKAINLAVVGDMAEYVLPGRETIKALIKAVNNTDLFVHVGDMSYADDAAEAAFPRYEGEWNNFQNSMEPITSRKFYMTAPGNHEVTCGQWNDTEHCVKPDYIQHRNFSAYLHRFRMPGNESQGFENLWYSFNYGMAHFVIIDTETDFPDAPAGPNTTLNGGNFRPPGNQTAWLDKDLEIANNSRGIVPWIIVFGHRPFFGSLPEHVHDAKNTINCEACRQAFGPTFDKYKVDFYFSGHVHWYERLLPAYYDGKPLANNYTYQPGTIYITSGAGGTIEPIQHLNESAKAPAYANVTSQYGYVLLQIQNATHAQLNFIESHNNETLDTVQIDRKH
jgi:hypothetical protein